jgi:hypothetical protein
MSEDHAKDTWVRNGCRAHVVEHQGEVVGTFAIRANMPGLGDHVANAGYMVHKECRGALRRPCAAIPLRKPSGWL